EQPALRAGPDCVEELGVVVERGEDQRRARRAALAQSLQDADAVETRHAEVEQDDVGLLALDDLQRLHTVDGLASDDDVGREAEEAAQALADDGLVFDDANADHASLPASGSRTCTLNPRPRIDDTASEPLASWTRSRMRLGPL